MPMTLAETLLPRLAEWRPTGGGRHSWSERMADHGWTVTLSADRVDSVGGLFWELSLDRSQDLMDKSFTLRSWAVRLAGNVSGLLEPLRVVEVDEPRHEALLRSDAPARRGEDVLYYEAH